MPMPKLKKLISVSVYYLKDSMKKIVLICFLFSVFSCGNEVVEKPDNLIDKEVMISILHDITVMQSAENFNPSIFIQNNIKVNQVILKKYNIDKETFAENNRYYASDPHNYQKMFKVVAEKIEAEKEALNKQSVEETGKPIAPSDAPAIQ